MVSVQNTVDTGHEDMVHDAQMDYYGTRLATCSSDKSVKIFELKDGTQTHVADLRGHEGPVWQVAWAHPRFGSILATCSYDRKLIIWREDRPGAWNRMHEISNHDSSVNSVCWAPQEYGLMLAAGSSDGAVSITAQRPDTNQWETTKIPNAHTIGCNAVSWAPFNADGGPRRFVSGGCDNICKVWRFEECESKWIEESRLEGHSDWVRDVAWAPSIGGRIGRAIVASCSQDRRVIIWTKETESQQWSPKELHSFEDVVWHVSWSVSGNMLAVSGGDNKVSLWKETIEGQWVRISDVNKGQGNISASGNGQASISTSGGAQAVA